MSSLLILYLFVITLSLFCAFSSSPLVRTIQAYLQFCGAGILVAMGLTYDSVLLLVICSLIAWLVVRTAWFNLGVAMRMKDIIMLVEEWPGEPLASRAKLIRGGETVDSSPKLYSAEECSEWLDSAIRKNFATEIDKGRIDPEDFKKFVRDGSVLSPWSGK